MNIYYIVGIIIIIILFFSYGIPLIASKNKEGFNGSKKIVFVAYTADWCPHCVEFNDNVYGKLVDKFSNNEKVQITKVDCTNDRSGNTKTRGGNKINGFPSLVINVYENGKMKEIQYDGNRSVEDIVSYINSL
jgi:thiol:disulfide interchange protein